MIIAAVGAYVLVTYIQASHVGQQCFGECPSATSSTGTTHSPDPLIRQAIGPCESESCNILLLGSDSRTGLPPSQIAQNGTTSSIGGQRADTIMVVHTQPSGKSVILSFPRDLWVDIPGHGYNKINTSFEGGLNGGGPELVAKTIYQLTGLKISHFLYVNLAGFQGIVDALGGVDMCIPSENVNTPDGYITDPYTQLHIKPGCQRLNGVQALAYVRSRKLPCDFGGDFNRIGRQQQFLRAVINRLLEPSELIKLPGLIGPVLSKMRRDDGLSIADLVSLVGQLRGVSTGDVTFRDVPVDRTGIYPVPFPPYQLWIAHLAPQADELFRAVRDNYPLPAIGTSFVGAPLSEANITVTVGDQRSGGKAVGVEGILSEAGFDISPGLVVSAGLEGGPRGTVLEYGPNGADAAAVVHSYFPSIREEQVAAPTLNGSDVVLVINSSYLPQPVGSEGTGTAPGAGCLPPAS
jgi:LCP family protein required for cell wall assembly